MRRIFTSNLFKTFFSFVILTSVLSATVPAQKRRAASQPKTNQTVSEKKQTCAGGWSGIITFKKTLKDSLESDEPGIRKSIDRIKHKTSRDYDYTARAVIDGKDPQNPVVNTNVNFTDINLNWGQEKVFDTCNSRESGHWFIIEGNDDRHTQAQATGSARSFGLYVDEANGTYSFNIKFPDAVGTYKREEHTRRSGHCQAKNNEPFDRSTNEPAKIDGEGFSIAAEKLDPNNPDTITGTKIWGDDGTGKVRSFIYQVSWRFTRCPGKLQITELKFEHPKFPNFENWQEITDIIGTIDGNRIKIKAKVLNMAAETKYADLKIVETYKGDKYNGAMADEPLPNAESSFRIDGGEEKEFEFIWDSEGQAWFDDGRPHLLHRIKAVVSEDGRKKDEKEERLHIAPKPLILIHGIWSDYRVWEPLYQNLLTSRHSYQWKAFAVGKDASRGAMSMGKLGDPDWYSDSVYDNADQLARYVKYAQEETNAWHVDMVAHSTGGLVGRLYLHKLMPNVPDARPQVKNLIMLGTPNGGVPCVDAFYEKLGIFKKELKAARELTYEEITRFNQFVVNTGGTKLSALAGNSVPVICGGYEWNDGFVTVKSAHQGVSNVGQSNDLHYQLTNDKNFGNFVIPHLITGPKGTYPYPVRNDPTDWRRWQMSGSNLDADNNAAENLLAFVLLTDERRRGGPNDGAFENYFSNSNGINQQFSKHIKLAPKQTLEIEVPLESAPNFGITFIANPGVSVSLLNDRGVPVSKNSSDSPSAGTMFRMIMAKTAVTKSVWKLKLENTTDSEQLFAGFGWSLQGELPKEMMAAK